MGKQTDVKQPTRTETGQAGRQSRGRKRWGWVLVATGSFVLVWVVLALLGLVLNVGLMFAPAERVLALFICIGPLLVIGALMPGCGVRLLRGTRKVAGLDEALTTAPPAEPSGPLNDVS